MRGDVHSEIADRHQVGAGGLEVEIGLTKLEAVTSPSVFTCWPFRSKVAAIVCSWPADGQKARAGQGLRR